MLNVRHFSAPASTLRRALACTECHAVPADAAHATQPLQLTWGPLARTGGATPR